MNDDDIQQIFFVECEEALETVEAGLDACKAGSNDEETVNSIFRGVHSIKGGAGAFGYEALQSYTHGFENLLGDIREGEIDLGDDLIDLLLHALDLLRTHVEAARGGAAAPEDGELLARMEAARAQGAAVGGDPAKPSERTGDFDLDDDLDALLAELSSDEPEQAAQPAQTEQVEQVEQAAPGRPEEAEGAGSWLVHIRPHAGAMNNGGEPLLWLRELEELGGRCETCHAADLPVIERLLVDEGYFGWTFRMPASVSEAEVRDIFDFAGEDCSIAIGADEQVPPVKISIRETPAPDAAPTKPRKQAQPDRRASQASAGQSVRIDLAKLDKLIDGVGELVIAQAMLAQRLTNENFAHVEELGMLETLVRDIQEHAMAFRAQPIGSVFGRVPRLLRELSNNTGKNVRLEVSGETTELDKTVIERLSEPMTHLIRNAVDHGIESPEERIAAGKHAEGTLALSAEHKVGRIVIEIRDDGRGINREKVLAKAIENGIVAADVELSDDEVNQLIFAPGFSTAASVTSVSGRGVGMDVVKSNVRELGGRISISTEPGKGTTFTLALPLTLAISDGMLVQTGDQSLVIPLAHVIESLRPEPGDLSGMGTQRQMLNVRGRFVPVLSLGEMTYASHWIDDPSKGVLMLVETESHGQAALLVDAITDQRQFVIKTLDTHYRSIDSVAGATILGNGQVALIVDVDYLVQEANGAGKKTPVIPVAA